MIAVTSKAPSCGASLGRPWNPLYFNSRVNRDRISGNGSFHVEFLSAVDLTAKRFFNLSLSIRSAAMLQPGGSLSQAKALGESGRRRGISAGHKSLGFWRRRVPASVSLNPLVQFSLVLRWSFSRNRSTIGVVYTYIYTYVWIYINVRSRAPNYSRFYVQRNLDEAMIPDVTGDLGVSLLSGKSVRTVIDTSSDTSVSVFHHKKKDFI